MADHNVTAAAQHFNAEEAAAENACARAATAHGLTADQAEQCDDGDQGCPQCPWRKTPTGGAEPAPAEVAQRLGISKQLAERVASAPENPTAGVVGPAHQPIAQKGTAE